MNRLSPVALVFGFLVFWGLPSLEAQSVPGGEDQELRSLIQSFREASGFLPLVEDDPLTKAAQLYARELSQRGVISHRDLSGGSAAERIARQGLLGTVGEILGAGPRPGAIFQAWLESPGHRRALSDPRWKKWGLGLDRSSGPWVAVVLFLR